MEWAAGAATGLIIGVGDSPENSEFLVTIMCICNRYLLIFFDCLAHPNLSATFATDEK